jgi:hypothetical protein
MVCQQKSLLAVIQSTKLTIQPALSADDKIGPQISPVLDYASPHQYLSCPQRAGF